MPSQIKKSFFTINVHASINIIQTDRFYIENEKFCDLFVQNENGFEY